MGTFTVTLSYLPYFSAVCASVSSLTLEDAPENQLASFLEKGALLHCLFEGDTGRTSPNSVVSLHIRKHGGDLFSAAVRQHGFPYKWVQRICGVDLQSENPDSADLQPQVDVSAESVEAVVAALCRRFTCQVYLTRQIVALGESCVCVALYTLPLLSLLQTTTGCCWLRLLVSCSPATPNPSWYGGSTSPYRKFRYILSVCLLVTEFAVSQNDCFYSRLHSLQVWPSSTSKNAPTDSTWLLSKSNKVRTDLRTKVIIAWHLSAT